LADGAEKPTEGSGTTPGRPRGCMEGWAYQADPPQRYSGNYARYVAGGGLVRPHEDVAGFVTAQPGNRGDMARFYFFSLMLDQLLKEGLDGDLVELGVYKGSTAALIATLARRLGRTAFLMDTFEGFAAADLQGIDADKRMEFADTSVDAVRQHVGGANTRFIKGYFPATAAQLPSDGRYCVVHIDCDLYAPIAAALDYFYPRMVPGGFMIVHDYSSLHWNGAEQAVDEFFADKPECVVPLTDGAGSVVVRKAGNSTTGGLRGQRTPGLPVGEWVAAANGGLTPWLRAGWSTPEDWGIWGVGPTHELLVPVPEGSTGDVVFSLDIHAALLGARTTQTAGIFVAGEQIATWIFTLANNRAPRGIRVPKQLIENAGERAQMVRVQIRLHDLRPPPTLDPATPERRPLGLALHGIRLLAGV
jgi:Macrocin-O-methyltransferase (TylF)